MLTGSLVAQAQKSRLLTPRQLQQLALFARLAGGVRYFYPSQANGRADWNAFYIQAIPAVLQAPTQLALADTLRRVFAAVAPGVVIGTGAVYPPAPTPTPTPTIAGPLYRWEHCSLNLEKCGLGLVPVMMRLAHLPFASRLVADGPASKLPVTHTMQLGDSLSATIPLVLPQAQVFATRAGHQRSRRFRVAQQAHRLALVMQTWNVLQHFYPYRARLVQADWPAALRTGLRAADAARTDLALRAACQQLVARIGDRHVQVSQRTRTGLYIVPPDFALAFELLPDGQVVVARAQGQWAFTFPVGSTLEQVNSQPIGLLLDSLAQQIGAASSSVARQLAAQQLLRSYWHRTAAVRLTVRVSDALRTQQVTFRQLRLPPSRVSAIRRLPDSLMYLDAARLRYADFVRQLPALQRARGLIVDLRQRPGYGLQLALAHWATAPLQSDYVATPVLHAPDFVAATYDTVRSVDAARLPHLATPTVFLIGPGTFSYGETVVELIRHYQLGLLLGQPTGGTNGEMNFAAIGHHYRLSWTGNVVLNRDGQPYQGQGIPPAIEARPTLAAIRQQQDAALQQAIAYLLASPANSDAAPHK